MHINRQLAFLFIGNLTIVFVGMGLFPLLPLYAAQFGGDSTVVGLYLAVVYLSIALGSMLPSWLDARVSRKTLFQSTTLLGSPALALLGQAAELWQVVVLTSIVWFVGGVGLTSISVFTAQASDKRHRAQSFSLMGLTTPLGALIGGAAIGWLVDAYGYPTMLAALGALWVLLPLNAWFGIRYSEEVRPSVEKGRAAFSLGRSAPAFYLVLLSSVLAGITLNASRFGLSVQMHDLDFSARAVASTATISGLVTIPVVLWIGTLSDRMGGKVFLMLSYLMAAAGSLILVGASDLWHFWLSAVLILIARSVSSAVSFALVTNMLTPELFSRLLPRLNAVWWVAGIASLAGTGYMIEVLGTLIVFVVIALLALMAAALLVSLQESYIRRTVEISAAHQRQRPVRQRIIPWRALTKPWR